MALGCDHRAVAGREVNVAQSWGNGVDLEELTPPPHSVEAEQSVLGALLLDSTSWDQVANVLRTEDFHRPDHRLIFDAIRALAGEGKPCDAVLAAAELERTGQIAGTGGLAYLGRLVRDTPAAANIRAYADIVREKGILREISTLGSDVERAIAGGSNSTELLERTRATLERLQSTLPQAREVQPLDTQPVSTWSSKPNPAPRDWIIEGLVPARRVTSFLADGGLGKTTIAVQIGVHVAMNRQLYGLEVSGGPVLGIFCEDEEDELHRRVRAACAA
jgi:replicative DNA helicase